MHPKSKNKDGKPAKDQFKAKVWDYNDPDAPAFIRVVLPIPDNESEKSESKNSNMHMTYGMRMLIEVIWVQTCLLKQGQSPRIQIFALRSNHRSQE